MVFKLFGREPALWSGLFASAVMLVSAFAFPLSVDQQGVLNAFCTAAFGFLTWWFVARDGSNAAVLGLLKAVLAIGIAFGLNLTPENQSVVMTFAATVTAMFIRTQVTPVIRPFSPPFRKFSLIERTERTEHSTAPRYRGHASRMDTKPWYASKTIWASLRAGPTTLASSFSINIADLSGPLAGQILRVVTLIATTTAIYGLRDRAHGDRAGATGDAVFLK